MINHPIIAFYHKFTVDLTRIATAKLTDIEWFGVYNSLMWIPTFIQCNKCDKRCNGRCNNMHNRYISLCGKCVDAILKHRTEHTVTRAVTALTKYDYKVAEEIMVIEIGYRFDERAITHIVTVINALYYRGLNSDIIGAIIELWPR